MATDLRGTTRSGHSYKDPVYASIEAGLEKKYNLPTGLMSSVRTRGERSNADQVSEAGAATVYQVIPSTRDLFLKKYGVDAYESKEAAAEVAALHLKESFDRGGDWNAAVAEYHGGPSRSRWGPKTAAYVQRAGIGGGNPVSVGKYNNHEPLPNPTPLATFDENTWYDKGTGVGPLDARRPLGPDLRKKPSQLDADLARLNKLGPAAPVDKGIAGVDEVIATQAAQEKAETARAAITAGQRFSAAFQENSIGAAIYKSLDDTHPEAQPGHAADYVANMDTYEAGLSYDERLELRTSQSAEERLQIHDRIMERRKNTATVFSNGAASGVLWSLAGGVADPAGIVLGLGVGKAFQMAGVGSRALMAAGRPLAAVGSIAAEGALGGLGAAAAMDASGSYVTAHDYASFAGFGAAAGVALSPLTLRGARLDRTVQDFAAAAQQQGVTARVELQTRAAANVGTENPAKLGAEMDRLAAKDATDYVNSALAPVPEERKLFSLGEDGEPVIADPEVLADVVARNHLGAVSDEGDRAMIAGYQLNAERIVAQNPINEDALKTYLKLGGLESTNNTLLSSNNVMAKAFGTVALESSQGAAGRKPTAAIVQHMREQAYMRNIGEFNDLYHTFRKGEGVGVFSEAWNGKAYKEFNRRIFAEIEARSRGVGSEANPAVRKAVDKFEAGYNAMRVDQQTVGTVGHARLGTDSMGYQPHRMSAARAAALTPEQNAAIRDILSEQFQDGSKNSKDHKLEAGASGPVRGFDKAFSDTLATKYLETAKRRAMGGYDVPLHLHDPQAADIVYDTAKALNLKPDEADRLLGKFSRGGAGHTKGRLTMDLSAPIPDGKGGTMTLMELFDQDALGLYRGYARRVSGEVALAKYGIMGKKGLNVYREGIVATGGDAKTLRAFDQTAAEFLNTPFGEHNHKYMDNLRILTSLSRLGGMGFTQLGEYGNGLAALGVARTLSAMGSFKRLAKEVGQLSKGADSTNAILKDFDLQGGTLGIDEYHTTRLFDVPDNDIQLYSGENIGMGTRALRAGGNLQAMLSGHRMITAVQTRGMAEQIVHKAMAYVKSGADDAALNDMGIGPELRARLKSNLDKIAVFDSKGKLQELHIEKGDLTPSEVLELTAYIRRGASQIIQKTYIGETGKWAHNGMLKLLTQFRTFSLVSVEKQWGRNRVNYGALKSMMYLIGAMSFAVPIHLARLHIRTLGMSRSKREEYLDQNLTVASMARATAGYASASGYAGDIFDVGAGFAGGWFGTDVGQSVGVRGQGQGSVTGLIPGLGMADDAWKAMHGDSKKMARVLPFGNLPYVQPVIAGVTSR